MMQARGAEIVMGHEDWGLVEQYPNRYMTLAPTRDITVSNDLDLSLGDAKVRVLNTPGHTSGTLGAHIHCL
jgi:glyoxylase-like metal-dependent hydrolase (beta-lactamase superfamily II)